MQRKTVQGIEFKADKAGTFRATIARFDTGPDKEGDVYAGPEAFPLGKAVVISAYMHTSWNGALPTGKGVIGADEKAAWVDGEFFTETTQGRDTYLTVKRLAESGQGQWSYAYDALDYSTEAKDLEPFGAGARRLLKQLDVFEASPVLVGAGNGTATEAIKARRAVTQAKAVELDSAAIALIAQIDALADELDTATNDLMAQLNIPDPDAMSMEEGIVGDGDGNANNNPQSLASMPKGMTLADEAKAAPAAVLALVSRMKALAAVRAKDGRVLSAANRERLSALLDALGVASADIGDLLASTSPDEGKADDSAVDRYLEFEAQRTALIAAGVI